MDDDLIK